MKWLVRILIGVGAVVALLLIIGILLPRHYKVERSIAINAPAARVYGLIVNPRQWAKWTVWNKRDPAMQMSYSGAPSGAGAKWQWSSATEGNGMMEFTRAVQDRQIDYSLVFEDFGMRSSGAVQLTPAAGGTQVSWTNEGDVGFSPINRYFALAMDRLVGPDFEQGLAGLKALAEQNGQPQVPANGSDIKEKS